MVGRKGEKAMSGEDYKNDLGLAAVMAKRGDKSINGPVSAHLYESKAITPEEFNERNRAWSEKVAAELAQKKAKITQRSTYAEDVEATQGTGVGPTL